MIEERLLAVNPDTRVVTKFYFDHATDEITIKSEAEVQPHIELTKAAFNEARSDWKGDLHHVAAIPMVLLPQLAEKGIMTAGGRILDKAKLKAWLNDPDNRAFRTRPGWV